MSKHLTDAELAAEYWRAMADVRFYMWLCRSYDYGIRPPIPEAMTAKADMTRAELEYMTVARFARSPHAVAGQ